MVYTLPDHTQEQLGTLQEHSHESPASSASFDIALLRCSNNGWTIRQLAEALDVSRFYISSRIQRAVDTGEHLDLDVPMRSKATATLPILELPEPMRADLLHRLQGAIEDHSPERTADGLSPVVSAYTAALKAALHAGWDAHSIGAGIGVHPSTITRFTAYRTDLDEGLVYPPAPVQEDKLAWNAKHTAVAPVKISDEERATLHELGSTVHLKRGSRTKDHEGQQEAYEYTTLLGKWYLTGASRDELEKATGQGWAALRKRLSRWGYMADTTKK